MNKQTMKEESERPICSYVSPTIGFDSCQRSGIVVVKSQVWQTVTKNQVKRTISHLPIVLSENHVVRIGYIVPVVPRTRVDPNADGERRVRHAEERWRANGHGLLPRSVEIQTCPVSIDAGRDESRTVCWDAIESPASIEEILIEFPHDLTW